MEEGIMEQNLKVEHFVNEENMNALNMIPVSPLDKVELIHVDLDCPVVTYSSCMTNI
jgi:hypothetical protein